MDEVDMIQAKIKALILARNCLLIQRPSDLVALSHISEMIVDLTARQISLTSQPTIPAINAATAGALQAAITELDQKVRDSATATDIFAAATKLASVGKA